MKKVKVSDYFRMVPTEDGDLYSTGIGCIKCGEPIDKMTYLFDGSFDLEVDTYEKDSVILQVTENDLQNPRLVCLCGAVIPEGAFEEDWNEDGYLTITIKLEE